MPIYLPSINPQEPQQRGVQSQSQPIPITDPGAAVRKPSEQEQQISGLAGDLQQARLRESRINVETRLNETHDDFTLEFEGGRRPDGSVSTGYLNTVGSDATPEHAAQAFKTVEERAKVRRDSLRNDYERRLFDLGYTDKRQTYNSASLKHYHQQLQVRDAGVGQATLTSKVDEAVRAHETGDKDAFLAKSREAVVAAMRLSTTMGWQGNDPRRTELINKTTSSIHNSVTRQYLSITDGTAAQQAKDYLDNVPPSQIDPDTRTQLYDLIERQDLHETAQRNAAVGLSPAAAREELIKDTAHKISQEMLKTPYEEPEPQEPGAQRSYAEEFRQRDLAWKGRLAQAYVNADSIENSSLREATLKELKRAEDQHDSMMSRAGTTVLDDAERWLRENQDKSWSQAPEDKQQSVDAFGLKDKIDTYERERRNNTTDQRIFNEIHGYSVNDWKNIAGERERWTYEVRKEGMISDKDIQWSHEQMDKAVGLTKGYGRTQTEIVEKAKVGAAGVLGVKLYPDSTNDAAQAEMRKFIDKYRDMLDLEQLKKPEDRESQDDVMKRLQRNYIYEKATPAERAKMQITTDGRTVSLDQTNTPEVDARVIANHGNPADFEARAHAFNQLEVEKRTQRVNTTKQWMVDNNVSSLRTGATYHQDYIGLQDAAKALGWRPETVLEELGNLHFDGNIDPIFYGTRMHSGRVDYTTQDRPIGISILAFSNLRQIKR